jgi:hypothetical protein
LVLGKIIKIHREWGCYYGFWVDHWDGGRSSKERYSDYVLAENKEISMRDLIFVNGEN